MSFPERKFNTFIIEYIKPFENTNWPWIPNMKNRGTLHKWRIRINVCEKSKPPDNSHNFETKDRNKI